MCRGVLIDRRDKEKNISVSSVRLIKKKQQKQLKFQTKKL